jgi:hypothetical protein
MIIPDTKTDANFRPGIVIPLCRWKHGCGAAPDRRLRATRPAGTQAISTTASLVSAAHLHSRVREGRLV